MQSTFTLPPAIVPTVETTVLSDEEIKDWCSMLVDPKKSTREIIQDLLNHSVGDEMTKGDKLTCIQAIKLIDQGVIKDVDPIKPTNPTFHGRLPATDGLDGPEQEQEQ